MSDNENTQQLGSPLSGSDYIADIIKSISSSGIPDSSPRDEITTSAPPLPPTDLFASLLSNPELLSRLPTIIATVRPIMEMLSSGNFGASTTARTFSPTNAHTGEHEKMRAISSPRPEHRVDDHRSALLCALKPYLCDDRRRAIDYVIKLDRLGDVLKSL